MKDRISRRKANRSVRRGRILSLVMAVILLTGSFCSGSVLALSEDSVLICGKTEHTHGSECYTQQENLICGQEESAGHTHSDTCYTQQRNLVCGQEERPGHIHGEGCYTSRTTLICGMGENGEHVHGDGCYLIEPVLACGQQEDPGHSHTDSCYQTTSQLSCGQEERSGHTHTAECWNMENILTCTIEEHIHTDACYGGTESGLTDGNTDGSDDFADGTEQTDSDSDFSDSPQPENTEDEVRNGKLVDLGCLLQFVTVERSMADTPGQWEILAEKLTDFPEDLVVRETDQLRFTLYYELPGGALTGTTGVVYKLPLQSDEALDRENTEIIYGADGETPVGETVTDPNGKVVITFEKDVLEANDQGRILKGQYQFTAGADQLSWQEDRTADLYFPKDVKTEELESGEDKENVFFIRFVKDMEEESADSEETANSEGVSYDEESFETEEESGLDVEFSDDTETENQEGVRDGELVDLTGLIQSVTVERRSKDNSEDWELLAENVTYSQEDFVIGETDRLRFTLTYTIPGGTLEGTSGAVYQLPLQSAGTVEGGNVETTYGSDGQTPVWETITDTEGRVVITFQNDILESNDQGETLNGQYRFTAGADQLDWQEDGTADLYFRKSDNTEEQAAEEFTSGDTDNSVFVGFAKEMPEGEMPMAEPGGELSVSESWLNEYSGYTYDPDRESHTETLSSGTATVMRAARRIIKNADDSAQQINYKGGSRTSEDKKVEVSKTIAGTKLENVFDITLNVKTTEDITEIYEEPDMAVAIVMDISNTMTSSFGGTTRYQAAMVAAESFLDKFAASNHGASKIGFVAFNTDAHQIFGLSSCSTQEQANALKNTMRNETGVIINQGGYDVSHDRFTNIEAGLKRGWELIKDTPNENKYIVFLSDGFPTTYISSGYNGHDPYGYTFYDSVSNKWCLYGTSYSDEAAIRARNMATGIKNTGAKIFSIGVDVGGQTIQRYVDQTKKEDFSVVERTSTTYEIGSPTSAQAYKDWLRDKIGSGYYYDSTDTAGLNNAFDQIFVEIKKLTQEASQAKWVAADPMPDNVEFIGFYDKNPDLVFTDLNGQNTENGENTAAFDSGSAAIRWDLKKSGYNKSTSGSTTEYTYTLMYRVRLENESAGFVENQIYPTNKTTSLTYQIFNNNNGNITISADQTVEFPIPEVKGYLAELTFRKVDPSGYAVAGAEFTLSHDTENCSKCRGDGSRSVDVSERKATPDDEGRVAFTDIPSGHQYTLKETIIPDGYFSDGSTYKVTVAYDKITVIKKESSGSEIPIDDLDDWKIVNNTQYKLPNTGGSGTGLYTAGGLMLILAAGMLIVTNAKNRRKEGNASF